MESTTKPDNIPSRNAIRPAKSVNLLEMPKLVPVSVPRPVIEPLQQSVLKKSVNTALKASPNLIKILPKAMIPVKTSQGPKGNIILHGPNNEILSLQIKTPHVVNAVPSSLSLLPISLPKEAKAAMSKLSGVTLMQTTKLSPKEIAPKSQTPTTATATVSAAVSTSINSFVTSKNLEIKPITVTNSPKALTPAQAATTAIRSTLPQTNLLSKLYALKSDTKSVESVTIEKKPVAAKHQPLKFYPLKNESSMEISTTTGSNNRMINLQISNGKLSDPNGPIKMISANVNTIKEKEKLFEKLKPTSGEVNKGEITPPKAKSADATEETSSKSLVRLKTADPVIYANKKKIKQQSLLKNKMIEELQRSPRTKCRSKSLTFGETGFNAKKRRLSVASDSAIKKTKNDKSLSISPPITKTPPEAQVNKLLCPEKISTSSDSLISTSPIEEKIVSVPVNYVNSEVIEMNSSDDDDCKPKPIETVAVSRTSDSEFYNCLNWSNGIGSLKESNLQFQFNEFGLIEIIDRDIIKNEVEINYDKPIFEREFKSQKTLDYSDPYFCKGCNCKGAAVDFLAPEFCSHECIRRYNRRTVSGLNNKPTKKYTNRKKIGNILDEAKQEPASKSMNIFTWETYLAKCKGVPTPIDLFLNPFPCSPNMFQVGMKLEAIDPEHSSMFCVCTIVEKRGYRLKLHFDGYSKFYDFWVNADSMDIFPPGWCAKTNRFLHAPRGISPLSFNWPMYLNRTKALPAPRNLFTHLNSATHKTPFKIGMKIEADDLRNTGKVCVASIADILDNRILIHFDGWDDSYNYWIDITSPYIHPVNWHNKNGFSIVAPPDWKDHFVWNSYLVQTKSEPATEDLFHTRDAIKFKAGMKLEVVDKRNPSLIRPASVIMTDDYEIKVLFDGWNMEYAFWVEDDSPDIHPIGWCEITEHELESPPEYGSLPTRYDCEFPACRGEGNAKHPELNMHTNIMSCPYEPRNWSKEINKTGRLKDQANNRFDVTMHGKSKDYTLKSKRKAEPLQTPLLTKQPKQPKTIVQPEPAGISLLAPKVEAVDTNLETRINIARHLLCDYGPRFQQVYTLWKRNSECLAVNLPENHNGGKNPLEWSCDDVAQYVGRLPRCQTVAQEFIRQDIDGAAFLSLRQSDLSEYLKCKLGPAIKIYNQIVQLREDVVTRFLNNFSKVS